jgi:hypothetical protein
MYAVLDVLLMPVHIAFEAGRPEAIRQPILARPDK